MEDQFGSKLSWFLMLLNFVCICTVNSMEEDTNYTAENLKFDFQHLEKNTHQFVEFDLEDTLYANDASGFYELLPFYKKVNVQDKMNIILHWNYVERKWELMKTEMLDSFHVLSRQNDSKINNSYFFDEKFKKVDVVDEHYDALHQYKVDIMKLKEENRKLKKELDETKHILNLINPEKIAFKEKQYKANIIELKKQNETLQTELNLTTKKLNVENVKHTNLKENLVTLMTEFANLTNEINHISYNLKDADERTIQDYKAKLRELKDRSEKNEKLNSPPETDSSLSIEIEKQDIVDPAHKITLTSSEYFGLVLDRNKKKFNRLKNLYNPENEITKLNLENEREKETISNIEAKEEENFQEDGEQESQEREPLKYFVSKEEFEMNYSEEESQDREPLTPSFKLTDEQIDQPRIFQNGANQEITENQIQNDELELQSQDQRH